jgi:hypothetical protein
MACPGVRARHSLTSGPQSGTVNVFACLRLGPFFMDVPKEVETRATSRLRRAASLVSREQRTRLGQSRCERPPSRATLSFALTNHDAETGRGVTPYIPAGKENNSPIDIH